MSAAAGPGWTTRGASLVLGLLMLSACPRQLASVLRPGSALGLELQDEDGAMQELGGQGPVRLIVIWASWCTVCERALTQATALVAEQKLYLATVSVDAKLDNAERLWRKLKLPGHFLWDPSARVSSPAGIAHAPTILLLDARGRVSEITEDASPASFERLRRRLIQLERAAGPAPPSRTPQAGA